MTPEVIKYITTGLLILLFHNIHAQDLSGQSTAGAAMESEPDRKHRLHLELGGRTFLFGSLNYEYALHNRFSLGAGLGFINFQQGDIIRDNNGSSETGRYRDIATSQMIYGNYFVGKNKHRLLLTAGLTHFLFTSRNKYPSETEFFAESQVEWNAGIGYQLSLKKMYFRLTGYCIGMPEPTGWFPKYMPWVGISLGYRI